MIFYSIWPMRKNTCSPLSYVTAKFSYLSLLLCIQVHIPAFGQGLFKHWLTTLTYQPNRCYIQTNKRREVYENVLYTPNTFYIFRPFMWPSSGTCITKDRYTEILHPCLDGDLLRTCYIFTHQNKYFNNFYLYLNY